MILSGFRRFQTISKYFSLLYLKSMVHFLSFVPYVSGCFGFLELFLRLQQFQWIENHMISPFLSLIKSKMSRELLGLTHFQLCNQRLWDAYLCPSNLLYGQQYHSRQLNTLDSLMPLNQPILFNFMACMKPSFISADNFSVRLIFLVSLNLLKKRFSRYGLSWIIDSPCRFL